MCVRAKRDYLGRFSGLSPPPQLPLQVERERIRQFLPTIPEFKNLDAKRIAEIEAAVKHKVRYGTIE